MRLVVEAAHLNRVLSFIKGCVPAKSTLPILRHIFFCAADGRLTVRACNMQREAEASCPAQVEDGVMFTLPGKMLLGIAANLAPGAQVGFTIKPADRIELQSGGSKFTLRSLDAKEFPALSAYLGETTASFDMDAALLARTLSAVAYVSERDIMVTPTLYGVHLYPQDGSLVAISSDIKRIARREVALPPGAESMPPILLPFDSISDISGALKSIEGQVTVKIGTSVVEFCSDTSRLTSRLMGKEIPPGLKAIPPPGGVDFTVHPVALKAAVERAQQVYFHSEAKNIEKEARIEASDGKLTIAMGDGAHDLAREEVEASVHQAKALCLDASYLSDMLKGWPEDGEIDVYQEGPGKGVYFTSKKYPSDLTMMGQMIPKRSRAKRSEAA